MQHIEYLFLPFVCLLYYYCILTVKSKIQLHTVLPLPLQSLSGFTEAFNVAFLLLLLLVLSATDIKPDIPVLEFITAAFSQFGKMVTPRCESVQRY